MKKELRYLHECIWYRKCSMKEGMLFNLGLCSLCKIVAVDNLKAVIGCPNKFIKKRKKGYVRVCPYFLALENVLHNKYYV